MAPRIVEVSEKEKQRKQRQRRRMGLPKINKIFTTTELKSLPGFTSRLKDVSDEGEQDEKSITDSKQHETEIDTKNVEKKLSATEDDDTAITTKRISTKDNETAINTKTLDTSPSNLKENETDKDANILDKADSSLDMKPKPNATKDGHRKKGDRKTTDSLDANPRKNIKQDSLKSLLRAKSNDPKKLKDLQKIADTLDGSDGKQQVISSLKQQQQQQDQTTLSFFHEPANYPPERSLNSDGGDTDSTIHSPMSSSDRSNSSSISSNRSSVTSPYSKTFIYADWPKNVSGKRARTSKLKLYSEEPVPCAHCKKKVESKYLLYSLDRYWHEKCLKCDFCRKPLFKFGDRFYFRQGAKFCHDDFAR